MGQLDFHSTHNFFAFHFKRSSFYPSADV